MKQDDEKVALTRAPASVGDIVEIASDRFIVVGESTTTDGFGGTVRIVGLVTTPADPSFDERVEWTQDDHDVVVIHRASYRPPDERERVPDTEQP